jgi:hypothetical protein
MRNTPYPAHTFGDFGHRIVPLTEIKGMIQGIVKVHEPKYILKQDVEDFDDLAAGDKKVISDETDIEIAVFSSSEAASTGHSSYIRRQRLSVEKGATLTGPMSWRPATTPAEVVDPRPGKMAFGLICLVIAFFGGLIALFSSTYSIGYFAGSGICLIIWLGVVAADNIRRRGIERIGSAYVLARKV